ncbi:hypothetical protein UNDYM_0914 [Undibacterium sp. YM2]|uniref:hypothetical protein n=1 Tax=unclassified Undibacterium TaxID=2630295 RepID=UPI001331D967|nr:MULTISPECIES: hypothetical protein [unclassified Undibacterium]BBB59206.1 hypothetical protein UNDKW_0933 [Undibacterium sp. KW1]BBB65167.1 hypothetical protein UNDYM_0914 [Undibacterium sp. YM2]
MNSSRRETIRRYAIATLLTFAVFGLGYICGQKSEQQTPAISKANGLNSAPSRASVRSDFLKQQQKRKAALIV